MVLLASRSVGPHGLILLTITEVFQKGVLLSVIVTHVEGVAASFGLEYSRTSAWYVFIGRRTTSLKVINHARTTFISLDFTRLPLLLGSRRAVGRKVDA